MKLIKGISIAIITSLILFSCKSNTDESQSNQNISERIVSLNGAITEIVAVLGYEKNIVGVDVTSSYPEGIRERTKNLGHVRSISVENIISLQPTLVLASTKDLNPDLISKLKTANILVKTIEQNQSIEGTKQFIKDVADAMGDTNYTTLTDKIDLEFGQVKEFENGKPKVLFVYARGAGTLMVAGKNTAMDKLITIAQADNAVQDFEDFKPLTPESLIQSNPDYILFFETGLQSIGGIDGALQIQGIEQTNAGKNRKIIAMDGALLSGFGPRVGEAAKKLNQLLSE
jgi:iron complex transport system substrate-binding protein